MEKKTIKSRTLYPKNKNPNKTKQQKTPKHKTNRMVIEAVTEMLPNRMSKLSTAYLLEILHFLVVYSALAAMVNSSYIQYRQ